MTRRLFAVVGPSGAGKDMLMDMACKATGARAVRRVITRPQNAGGEDFDGVTPEAFARREAAGDFALSWQAHGLSYGIPAAALEGEGLILFNASRSVLQQAAARFPDLVVLLVTAPPHVLAARLKGRGRESGEDQARRLARAEFTLPGGLRVREVRNDSTPQSALARFLAALQPESA